MIARNSNLSFLIFISIAVLCAPKAEAKVEATIGTVAVAQNSNNPGFLPATDESEILLSRKEYLISYNKKNRVPNWAAWKLESKDLGSAGRSGVFETDTDLEEYFKKKDPSYHAVEPHEYVDFCFDRGHQTPSADRSHDEDMNKMTFLMSNMAPQTAYLNRVLWEHLEVHERELVEKEHKSLYIIAGPIFDPSAKGIGPHSDILVPSKFFKIIFVLNAGQTAQDIHQSTPVISVIMPNIDLDGALPNISGTPLKSCKPFAVKNEDMSDWSKFQVGLSDVEAAAHLQIPVPK